MQALQYSHGIRMDTIPINCSTVQISCSFSDLYIAQYEPDTVHRPTVVCAGVGAWLLSNNCQAFWYGFV